MKCMYCGAKLQEGSVYCFKCGKEAQMVQNIDSFEDEYLTGILEQGQQKKQSTLTPEQRKKRQEKMRKEQQRRKKQRRLIAFWFFVGAAAVLGVIIALYMKYTIDTEHANSFDYQLMMANEAYASGDIRQSIVYYENALQLEPDNLGVRMKLADIYFNRKEFDSALYMYLEILETDADNLDCYARIIEIYETKNKINEILDMAANITDPEVLALFSEYIVHEPQFSVAGGTYGEYLTIAITSDAGHQICYTLDGTDPSVYGRIYKEPIELDKMGTYTVRAVCVNAKKLYSEVVKQEYVIDIPAPDMPEVFPNGGTFDEETLVAINLPDHCTAYYTWDGTIPNTTSPKYKEEMPIPEGNNILSIMIVDDKTGKWSEIYRGRFVYYPAADTGDGEGDAPGDGETADVSATITE